ncbi:hypothetical protein BpHYR1_043973 [Brachionus plicatilis]|uniref:Uncharacterized protein n=1 Tax=Brachionus plicatilis TaxID=10195 RepID=A0A3M7Q1D7_BRAPC|nr:hypothetical protein BpHYR1_043973 [Brachionus plicatilis]
MPQKIFFFKYSYKYECADLEFIYFLSFIYSSSQIFRGVVNFFSIHKKLNNFLLYGTMVIAINNRGFKISLKNNFVQKSYFSGIMLGIFCPESTRVDSTKLIF